MSLVFREESPELVDIGEHLHPMCSNGAETVTAAPLESVWFLQAAWRLLEPDVVKVAELDECLDCSGLLNQCSICPLCLVIVMLW